jgi:hypothetical protein
MRHSEPELDPEAEVLTGREEETGGGGGATASCTDTATGAAERPGGGAGRAFGAQALPTAAADVAEALLGIAGAGTVGTATATLGAEARRATGAGGRRSK